MVSFLSGTELCCNLIVKYLMLNSRRRFLKVFDLKTYIVIVLTLYHYTYTILNKIENMSNISRISVTLIVYTSLKSDRFFFYSRKGVYT